MKNTPHCIEILRRGLSEGAFPSAVVAVGRGQKVYLCEAMGNRHENPKRHKAHKSTLYDLASLTKLVAPTMIALRMVEEGRLLLTDTLDRYFTPEELKNAPAGRAGVTIYQLMTHTSGITPHFPLWLTTVEGFSLTSATQTGDDGEENVMADEGELSETVAEETVLETTEEPAEETLSETTEEPSEETAKAAVEAPAETISVETTAEEIIAQVSTEMLTAEDKAEVSEPKDKKSKEEDKKAKKEKKKKGKGKVEVPAEEQNSMVETGPKIISPEDAVAAILASTPVCEPGAEVHYSCMGYILLGKILERIAGKPLDVLAKTMVFRPLGMNHTTYNPKGNDIAATEYSEMRGQYICGEVHDENAHFLGGVSANAGVFAPIGDMIQFAAMLSEQGKTPNGRFLSQATFDLALKNYTPGLSEARGLGFQLQPAMPALTSMGDMMSEGSYGHTGFTGTSLFVDAKTGRWAILLTNAVHYGRDNKAAFLRYRRLFHNAVMADDFGEKNKKK